jgi:hypothetical protein
VGKGRFLNQKLGKRTSRKLDLLKSRLTAEQARNPRASSDLRLPKKGASRAPKTG